MKITTLSFPGLIDGRDVDYFILSNKYGNRAVLSTLGAGIVAIEIHEPDGSVSDMVIGYDKPESYMADGPCAGKIPGRFANRIAGGHFTLDGKEYSLAINNGPNALHGGPTGFQNRIWKAHVLPDESGVEMTYVSADGEEGYPGQLTVRALYTWDDNNILTLRLRATTDAPTIINLTNHSYFNLDGENSGSILDHTLKIEASTYLPIDKTQVPTGDVAQVAGTPMDFTEFKRIGRDINADFEPLKIAKGYDHCFPIDGHVKGQLAKAATLRGAVKGHTLEVWTTQPAIQVYTGNWLKGCPRSISGGSYDDYAGVAIECQNYPDAPNKPQFPSSVLRPGEEYDETIQFRFS